MEQLEFDLKFDPIQKITIDIEIVKKSQDGLRKCFFSRMHELEKFVNEQFEEIKNLKSEIERLKMENMAIYN